MFSHPLLALTPSPHSRTDRPSHGYLRLRVIDAARAFSVLATAGEDPARPSVCSKRACGRHPYIHLPAGFIKPSTFAHQLVLLAGARRLYRRPRSTPRAARPGVDSITARSTIAGSERIPTGRSSEPRGLCGRLPISAARRRSARATPPTAAEGRSRVPNRLHHPLCEASSRRRGLVIPGNPVHGPSGGRRLRP